jgi:phage gpG-like protein
MIGVKINSENVERKLRLMARQLEQTETPNRAAAIELYQFVMKNFQTEGGMTEAGAWEPLADSTVAWKERRGYQMVLQNTGALRASFEPFSDATMAGVGARQLTGTIDGRDPDIAEVHEFGLGNVPARPMLPSYDQALAIGMRVYDYFVEQAQRRAGL